MFDALREDLRLARRGVRRAGGFAVTARMLAMYKKKER